MRKLLFLFIAVFAFSCSSDDGGNTTNPEVTKPEPENPEPVDCVYTGNVSLTTQDEVNAFAAHKYCKIDGNVYIGWGVTPDVESDITDLSGLASLKEITRYLTINMNNNLISLHGLEGLEKILGLDIKHNEKLKSISGLSGLKQIGEYGNVDCVFNIINNSSLLDLTGLENLNILSILQINNNESLINLKGLNNVEKIGSIEISGNRFLGSLEGLNNLKECYSIYLRDNKLLSSIVDLGNLEKLNMFSSYESVSLVSLNGLEKITTIGSINLYQNIALESIAGLRGLTNLHELRLNYVDNLSSLVGLENVKTMAALNIENCSGLTSIEQLNITDFVEKTGGSNAYPGVYISGTSINSLNGLESITSFVGEFNFNNNTHLTNFCAINNIVTPTTSFETKNNAYNPTAADIIAGNCNQ